MLLLNKIKFVFLLVVICIALMVIRNAFWVHKTIYPNSLNQHNNKVLSQSLYLDRIEHLNKACHRYNLSTQSLEALWKNKDVLEHILVDSKHRLLYCYVPKVACTNWKRVLMMLTGKSNSTDALAIPANSAHSRQAISALSNYTLSDAQHFLKTYTKFLFVRHPFERLLSAFRNKLERNYIRSKYFQARVGKLIVKKYRRKSTNASLETGEDVTFEEFTAYLTQSSTFSYNEHWKPVHVLCQPCLINYDFIGKYETLYTDSNFLLNNIGASHIKFPQSFKSAGTSKELKKYFSTLSSSRIKELYAIYESDFRLFSYDLHNLLGYEVI